MVVGSPRGTIAQKQFVIGASQQRVWDLLAMVTYQELPFEKVNIVNLDSFRAILKWGIGCIRFPFQVEGKLVDTVCPNSYGCVISVKNGPLEFSVKVLITLRTVGESKTEVFFMANEEGKGSIIRWLLRGAQRNFALEIFDSIGARLQRLCS